MLEKDFQRILIGELEELLPEALIYKNEGKQGFPDLTILYQNHWALLECKRSRTATKRPNQDIYVKKADEMSFARIIYPENKQEVLDELQQAFGIKR